MYWNEFSHLPGTKDHLRVGMKGVLTHFVVKRVALPNEAAMSEARREIENLAELRGKPGVITFYASTANAMLLGDEVYIVMEEANGNLRDLVISKPMDTVTLGTRLRLFADILRAVIGLASLGKVHRDLDPSNIVIVGDILHDPDSCSAVICDVQHVCTLPNGQETTRSKAPGQPLYTAPEAWDQASAEQDVWSCGMLMFQMLTGNVPETLTGPATPEEVRGRIQAGFHIEDSRLHHELREIVPELATLVQRMMDPDPRKRCTAEEALESLEADAARHGVDVSPRSRSPPPLPSWLKRWAPSALQTPPKQAETQAAMDVEGTEEEGATNSGILARLRNAAQRLRPGVLVGHEEAQGGAVGGKAMQA